MFKQSIYINIATFAIIKQNWEKQQKMILRNLDSEYSLYFWN